MHWTTLVAFVGLEIVLCFIPGPAVLSVVGATLGGRARAGFATAFGILTGNAIYFVVSALGVASVIAASRTAFVIIKWCGALYLGYLGLRSLLVSERRAHEGAAATPSAHRGWRNGTIVQLSNPKALIFFTAILPQFIDPHAAILLQISVLGVAGLLVELGVLAIYIAAADRVVSYGLQRQHLWAQRLGGALLLGVAAAVARSG